jgi:hypothetical protein
MNSLASFIKNHQLLIKMRRPQLLMYLLKLLVFIIIGNFNLQEVKARTSNADTLFNTLEDQSQILPKAKSLLPTTEFRFETESHRLRIPRYMAYLLQNENFLNSFPEYRTLVPDFEKVIRAANGHDIEKQPKPIYTKLAHDRGVDYDKLPKEEAAKAKAFRAKFNADGEVKSAKLMKSLGFVDGSGETTKSGKLFYTLEAFVDRWDAYKFRAQEFGKKMLRPGDYVRQVMKPSGFSTDHYNIDKVAEMDDFVNTQQNGVNMEKAVGRVTPQEYKRIRNHFRGSDPSFEDIQQAQESKLVAEHSEKMQAKKSKVSLSSETKNRSLIKGAASSTSASKGVVNGLMNIGIAGAVAHSIHDATDSRKELGEAVGSITESTWNLGSTLATGGLLNLSTLGDDMADRYADPKVYEDFLNSPLEQQEMIIRGNNTLPFRTVIFSKRPRITQLQCPTKTADSPSLKQEPFEFDVYSPERQKIHMKMFTDNNRPMFIIGKLASPVSSEDKEIRLGLQSQQACFSLPQFSNDQHAFIIKNKCTSINAKGLPDLEPEMAQHFNPDFWNETVKVRDWTLKRFSQLQNCCKSDKCIKIMNKDKNIVEKSESPISKSKTGAQ